MTRRLLLLCHANIARSPAAELLARSLIGGAGTWSVLSRGTAAARGHRIDREMGDALRRRMIPVSSHRAHQATAADIREADLILAFEAGQRSWAIDLVPAAARSTFTIRRAAAALLRGGPGVLAADTRAYSAGDDFADPFGKGAAAAEAAVEEIDDLLRVILPAIGAVKRLPPKPVHQQTRRSLARVMAGSRP